MRLPRRKWTILGILAVAVMATGIFLVQSRREVPDKKTMAYSALLAAMEAGKLDSIRVQPGSSIDVWGGCIKVTTLEDGKAVMAFYDPDSLRLVAEI